MADLTNPVTKVTQWNGNTDTTWVGRFGANAEDVQIILKENNSNNVILQCSLLDFFKNWEDFKANNAFMYYGNVSEESETLAENVKFWYGHTVNNLQ